MDALTVTIDGGGGAVRLGPPGGAPGLHASGLAGWWGTPDGKWDLTERQLGDGAFAIEPSQVAYSSRTVTVDGYALGRTRAEALSSLAPLGAMAHRLVSIAVDDGVAETYATGALTAEVGKGVRGLRGPRRARSRGTRTPRTASRGRSPTGAAAPGPTSRR